MRDMGFFLCIALVGMLAFTLGAVVDSRRKRARQNRFDRRKPLPDIEFQMLVSALSPVPLEFVRAFRLAVGRALLLPADRMLPEDRFGRDLKVLNYDAVELVDALEHTFDMRVRVMDLVRARNLRGLCKLMYERQEEVSDFDPPLHRDPSPKLRSPDPEAEAAQAAPQVEL